MRGFVIFLHVVSAFAFVLAHGVSIGVAWRLRRERDPEEIRTLLGLSYSYVGVVHLTLLVVLVSGVVAGFMGHWWGRGWIWASLAVLIGLWAAMGLLGTRYYDRVRVAVGSEPFYRAKKPTPAPPEALEALLSSPRPTLLVIIGVAGLALILWLMTIKPF